MILGGDGSTVKFMPLLAAPATVTTMLPEVAPEGTADEIDIFDVSTGSNEHSITVVGGVDGRLDRRLIGGDMDRLLCEKNRRKNE